MIISGGIEFRLILEVKIRLILEAKFEDESLEIHTRNLISSKNKLTLQMH